MSVASKLKAMMNNQKFDSAQFSATNNSSTVDPDIFAAELQRIQDELEKFKSHQHATSVGISGVPTTTGGSSGGSLLPTQGLPYGGLGQMIGTLKFPPPLTPEEEVELRDLELEHARLLKKAKLDHFKSLPKTFRQSIIDVLLWEEAVGEINATGVPESDRLRELKQTKNMYGGPFGGYMGHPHHSSFGSLGGLGHPWDPSSILRTGTLLPVGLTKEDLIEAHMDASMEEELQGG